MNTTPHRATDAVDQTRPRHRRPSRWLRLLPALTLTAVLTITASTEFTLARTVLALPPAIAWALPVAIDSYVLAALRSGRDVPAAITVMAGALTAAMGAHLAAPDGEPLTPTVRVLAATGIMTALVVVAWRVHVLIETQHDDTGPADSAHPGTPVLVETSAPAPAAETKASGGRGVAAPADRPAIATAPSTAQPVAAAAAASTPRSTATAFVAPSAPSTPSEIRPGLTDAQILADLDGTSPGVRALKRTYAIGQARAARLHRQATEGPADRATDSTTSTDRTPTPTTEQHDRTDQNNREDQPQEMTETTDQRIPENHDQESTTETHQDQEQESDTRITDRVGSSRLTTRDAKTASRPLSAAIPAGGDR